MELFDPGQSTADINTDIHDFHNLLRSTRVALENEKWKWLEELRRNEFESRRLITTERERWQETIGQNSEAFKAQLSHMRASLSETIQRRPAGHGNNDLSRVNSLSNRPSEVEQTRAARDPLQRLMDAMPTDNKFARSGSSIHGDGRQLNGHLWKEVPAADFSTPIVQ